MLEGIIVKGISGFFYVQTASGDVFECKARGRFRKEKIVPVVGDKVIIETIDKTHGIINDIKPRRNMLIRPLVSNIDQAVVVFAIKEPDINFTLLDKLLILIEHDKIDAVICINKSDLDDDKNFHSIKKIYESVGYTVLETNALLGNGIDELKKIINGNISVFAGPSGVGKSTLFNSVQDKIKMETGEISEKIRRGKHTTRHAELIQINKDTYLVDTPGFSSIDITFMKPEELQFAFKEFSPWNGMCKYQSCIHDKEVGCEVKEQVKNGIIPKERYDAYISILNELQNARR